MAHSKAVRSRLLEAKLACTLEHTDFALHFYNLEMPKERGVKNLEAKESTTLA